MCSAIIPAAPAVSTAIRAPFLTLRSVLPARSPAALRDGPERRRMDKPYVGVNRRAVYQKNFKIFREGFRLLQGGEVAALLHRRPARDPGVGLFRERARRSQDLLRELGVAQAHANRSAFGNRPSTVCACVVGPE